MFVKGYKLPAIRYMSSGNLEYRMVTIVFVAVKRKKKQLVFLFPFPENKEYKENSEQVP